ncbi:alpha/beta hydrolase family protein [Halomonas elongata]|uniref:Alpha/beta hydrolase family protein n=1 Tax=Halomonas elongata TaxID=2746 RepID=A0A1B8NVQ2_HALEL|nr:alpha/beta hydrolase [Halomonas elongata]OBX34057.1 alpha/beta hydrolase family protein [Halomonas elongata]
MPQPATATPLVFAHANGFPGRSYRSFLAPLEARFDMHPVEQLGHHPDFPVGHNWLALRDELLEQLQAFSEPVIGVGHSMGGVLTAMAAEQAPERFRCVVMLDPPLMLGVDAMAMKLAKRLGFVDRVTPAGRTLGRRSRWSDRSAMRDYLRRRSLFRRFTDQALDDYIEAVPGSSRRVGWFCAMTRYRSRHLPPPARSPERSPERARVPLGVLAGGESDLLTSRRRRRLRRRGVRVAEVPGGHMFPMEHPEATREALLAMLDTLLDGGGR